MPDAHPNADEQATATPAGTVTGHCLTCGKPHPLLPGGAVPEHNSPYDRSETCSGSLRRSVQLDDLDDARREAIGHIGRLDIQARRLRDELARNLAGRLALGDLIDLDAAAIIPLEAEAEAWRDVAWHGDVWKTAAEALSRVTGRPVSIGGDLQAATQALRLVGQQRWLRSALVDQLGKPGGSGHLPELLHGVLLTMPT